MNELFLQKTDSRKLAHAYLALAMAQDVAKKYVHEQPEHISLHPLLSVLEVSAHLLEEILQNSMPEEGPLSLPLECSEVIM